MNDAETIAADPRYRDLVRRRGRLALVLTLVLLAAYFGFILLVAFAGPLLARPIGAGVTSVGIPLGIGLILLVIVLTGLYVRAANRTFDPLTDAIRAEHDR